MRLILKGVTNRQVLEFILKAQLAFNFGDDSKKNGQLPLFSDSGSIKNNPKLHPTKVPVKTKRGTHYATRYKRTKGRNEGTPELKFSDDKPKFTKKQQGYYESVKAALSDNTEREIKEFEEYIRVAKRMEEEHQDFFIPIYDKILRELKNKLREKGSHDKRTASEGVFGNWNFRIRGKLRERVQYSQGLIEQSLNLPQKEPVPVKKTVARRMGGFFKYASFAGTGEYIGETASLGINPKGAVEHAFIHEFGHYLHLAHITDYTPNTVKQKDGGLGSLYDVIMKSSNIQDMVNGDILKMPEKKRAWIENKRRDLSYWIDPSELFARAFAQYITVKTGDSKLQEQLEERQLKYSQWTDEDFKPIEAEMDKLFKRNGWLK